MAGPRHTSEKIALVKGSIDKLRWALAGGSLFLLLLLIAVVGYGRYRAASLWKNRLAGLGVHLEQTTDNVTYSQTIQGRTVFTLRAGKAVQHKDGKTILHNVQLTLYGKKDGSEDHIYGSEFEYDDKSGVARALGDVEMDLRAPGSLTKPARSQGAGKMGTAVDQHDIHVRTSGLTYVRKLGVAATDQPVMFSYAGLQCAAKGAEFNSGEGIIHLLANVQLQGVFRGKQVILHAAKADLNHTTDSIALAEPDVQSGDEKARATNAVLNLRHDGSVETAHAEGNVVLQKLTRQIKAARLDGSLTSDNVPQRASLTGGVVVVDTNAAKPMRGSASRLDGVFDASGAPMKWTASGGAQLMTSERDATGQMLLRSLKGNQIVAAMKPGGKTRSKDDLSDIHVVGQAHASAEAAAIGGTRTTQIDGDDLRAFFTRADGASPTLQSVVGTGKTRLQQDAPGGAQQISTGNSLHISFRPDKNKRGELQVATATQDGDVRVRSRAAAKSNGAKSPEPVSASADHSSYDGGTEALTLMGSARFSQGNTLITASSFAIDKRTGDSDAKGNVLATLAPADGRTGVEATHLHADRAHLVRDTQVGLFYGSDAAPARLWQGASQVEAATITLDGKKHSLAARPAVAGGSVRAVFGAAAGGKSASVASAHDPQIERVVANSMDYDDVSHVATFTGNLHAQGATGQVQAEHAQMYFLAKPEADSPAATSSAGFGNAPSMGGSLEKAVVSGNVHLSQPGKTGRGDKLVYTASDSTFVLTGSPGHPPQIVDAERGSVTGATLRFRSGDNAVEVSGSNAAADDHVRVHTETGARQ